MDIKIFTELALSFAEAEEQPHFAKNSFRVRKKIFATLDLKKSIACFRFSIEDQSAFTVFNPEHIYPVPNKWGLQGWTFFHIENCEEEIIKDALTTSYCGVAPKKLAEKYQT